MVGMSSRIGDSSLHDRRFLLTVVSSPQHFGHTRISIGRAAGGIVRDVEGSRAYNPAGSGSRLSARRRRAPWNATFALREGGHNLALEK